MKKLVYIITALSLTVAACKKITTDDVTTRVVKPNFPGLTLKGESVVSTGLGTGTFTDPGATGYDSIANTSTELQPLANNVDLTEPGFYGVQYEAKNVYGYRTNKSRLVLVTTVPPADDISGTYVRAATGQEVTLTKQGQGLYIINNIGGVANDPDFVFSIYLGLPTDSTLEIPAQPSPLGGNVFVEGGRVVRDGDNITFSYIVRGTRFGTARRTFTKVQ